MFENLIKSVKIKQNTKINYRLGSIFFSLEGAGAGVRLSEPKSDFFGVSSTATLLLKYDNAKCIL